MLATIDRKGVRQRVRHRIRNKVRGTAHRPRLAVFRSLRHIYVQAIDDEAGRTLATASSLEKDLGGPGRHGCNAEMAKRVGDLMGQRLKDAGIETVVFDRGGFLFHGRLRALAEAVRTAGMKF